MKIASIICGVLLFLALLKLPIGYYTFLRIAITITSILVIVEQYKKESINFWVIIFGIIAILFNPIIPVYLYKKSLWMPIDLISSLMFLGYGLKGKIIKIK